MRFFVRGGCAPRDGLGDPISRSNHKGAARDNRLVIN